MNDKDIMRLAGEILKKHKIDDIFSYRYAFLLGYKVCVDQLHKFLELECEKGVKDD